MTLAPVDNARSEILKYVDLVFRTHPGFVYAPTFDRESSHWEPRFFEWPQQRDALVDGIISRTGTVETYIGPCLYKSPTRPVKDNILGTYVTYTEIDGIYNPQGFPTRPSFFIRSSERKNHVHFYFIMDEFESDVTKIERANRALVYTIQADASAWDATQVLRPPLTYNHKRESWTSIINVNPSYVPVLWNDFLKIELPEILVDPLQEGAIGEIPPVEKVSRDSRLSEEFQELFRANVEQGKRSEALMKIGYFGAEAQLTNEEIISLLLNCDERWGKFKGRKDRMRRLLDIVERARIKHPLAGMPEFVPLAPRELYPFLESQIEPDWAIPEFLDKQGLMVWSGQPGVGKTQGSLQFGFHMAMGKEFCGFEVTRPLKIAFCSVEMSDRQLAYIIKKILDGMALTPTERALLGTNFVIPDLSNLRIHLDKSDSILLLNDFIRTHRPDGIVIDSLGMVISGELNDDPTIRRTFGNLTDLSKRENVFFWLIHHNRKPQVNNKRPNALGDIYGSQYITSLASTVVSMWPKANRVKEVSILKNRLGFMDGKQDWLHGEDLIFTRHEPTAIMQQVKEEQKGNFPNSLDIQ